MPNNNLKPNSVLKSPRVTEKAALLTESRNVHVFEVTKGATERAVKASIKATYGVTPLRVRLANIPAKPITRRGVKGTKVGGRKAYIYLKKGDKIES
jgi:large subunit ribosomal protein L23